MGVGRTRFSIGLKRDLQTAGGRLPFSAGLIPSLQQEHFYFLPASLRPTTSNQPIKNLKKPYLSTRKYLSITLRKTCERNLEREEKMVLEKIIFNLIKLNSRKHDEGMATQMVADYVLGKEKPDRTGLLSSMKKKAIGIVYLLSTIILGGPAVAVAGDSLPVNNPVKSYTRTVSSFDAAAGSVEVVDCASCHGSVRLLGMVPPNVYFTNTFSVDALVTVGISISDSDGNVVYTDERPETLPPNAETGFPFDISSTVSGLPFGIYEMTGYIKDDDGKVVSEMYSQVFKLKYGSDNDGDTFTSIGTWYNGPTHVGIEREGWPPLTSICTGDNPDGSGDHSAIFEIGGLQESGYYELYMSFPHVPNSGKDHSVAIVENGSPVYTFLLDQTEPIDGMTRFGDYFPLEPGNVYEVTLSNGENELCVDAVNFRYVGETNPNENTGDTPGDTTSPDANGGGGGGCFLTILVSG